MILRGSPWSAETLSRLSLLLLLLPLLLLSSSLLLLLPKHSRARRRMLCADTAFRPKAADKDEELLVLSVVFKHIGGRSTWQSAASDAEPNADENMDRPRIPSASPAVG